jgi:putative transposase
MSVEEKRMCIESNHPQLSIRRQCDLFGLNRSSLYYEPVPVGEEDLLIMREIDEIYTKFPSYGVPRMTRELKNRGYPVGKKRVRRLMHEMNIQAIYPKPNLSKPRKDHPVYPYLLKDLKIIAPNQVWCTDITYIRVRRGFVYLVSIMDWYSRFVLSWEVSINLDVDFCLRALEGAFRHGLPSIFNSDQGSQFTSLSFTGILEKKEILISMDGRGRVYDNIFIERLWRSVKYEEVYLRDYEDIHEAREGLSRYFELYNNERLHQSLDYRTPASVYFERKEVRATA